MNQAPPLAVAAAVALAAASAATVPLPARAQALDIDHAAQMFCARLDAGEDPHQALTAAMVRSPGFSLLHVLAEPRVQGDYRVSHVAVIRRAVAYCPEKLRQISREDQRRGR